MGLAGALEERRYRADRVEVRRVATWPVCVFGCMCIHSRVRCCVRFASLCRDRWTNAQVDGTWTLTSEERALLTNGPYTARLYLDQTQRALAQSAPFVVTGARARASRGGGAPSPWQRRH